VQGNGGFQVGEFLGKAKREGDKAPDERPHGQVVPLNIWLC
jgi:hypothetical protein